MISKEECASSLFDDDWFEQWTEDVQVDPLQRAGMDEHTEVDTVLNANGNFIFVTEV